MAFLMACFLAPSVAEANAEIMQREIVRVQVRLDLPEGARSGGSWCADGFERINLRVRESRDGNTGQVVQRGLSLTVDCMRIVDGEPESSGTAIWDSARLRRFEIDKETGNVTIRFAEHPGYNPRTGKASPVWTLTVVRGASTEPAPYSLRNRCGGVKLRQDEVSFEATVEGVIFGHDIEFNELIDRARIDHWTSLGVCVW